MGLARGRAAAPQMAKCIEYIRLSRFPLYPSRWLVLAR